MKLIVFIFFKASCPAPIDLSMSQDSLSLHLQDEGACALPGAISTPLHMSSPTLPLQPPAVSPNSSSVRQGKANKNKETISRLLDLIVAHQELKKKKDENASNIDIQNKIAALEEELRQANHKIGYLLAQLTFDQQKYLAIIEAKDETIKILKSMLQLK